MIRKFLRWIGRALITVVVLVLIAAISDFYQHRVPAGSVLEIRLTGPVVERESPGVLGLLTAHQTPLNLVRRALYRGARDSRIAGVAVKVIDPEMDFAQAQEIAAMVAAFRARGKWAAAYIETAGEGEPGNLPYIVAASAGEVSLMPEGEIGVVGVGLREMFGRGTLDWLGIRPEFAAIGKYKRAADVFMEKDFTPPAREEDEALVTDLYDQLVGTIASQRHLDPASVRALIDQAPLPASQSLKAHLVDRLEYEDEFTNRIEEYGGAHHYRLDYADYTRPRIFAGLGGGDRIAVIYGLGSIERGQAGFDPLSQSSDAMGSDEMVKAFKEARENDSVRAVVFRINSPGGSAIASELIRREAEITASRKPVVISMSGYGASGGYWIATAGQKMIAEPATITGSIGVLGGKFNITPAAQKIYMNTGSIVRGANFEMFDLYSDFTPAQMKLLQEQELGGTYQHFIKIVAAARHMSVEQVEQVAQGRVWTGRQALEAKLVDSLGGFDDALDAAKALARIPVEEEVRIAELPVAPGLLESLFMGRFPGASSMLGYAGRAFDPLASAIRAAIKGHGAFLAAYCPVIATM